MGIELNETDRALWRGWFGAAADPVIDGKLRELCAYVDEKSAARDVVCWGSGQCCRFESFGHRLFVTGLEAAWVVGNVRKDGDRDGGRDTRPTGEGEGTALPLLTSGGASGGASGFTSGGACVFQRDRVCSIHTMRPAACRIFFCQNGDEDAQQALYEQVQREVRRLHDEHGLAYRYMEWRVAVEAGRVSLGS